MREPNLVDDYIRMNPRTGLFEPVWMYRAIVPFWLGPDPMFSNHDPIVINASGTPTQPVTYKLPHSSQGLDDYVGNPMLINRMVFEDDTAHAYLSNFTVLMEDIGEQLRYMNYPVHIRTFAGGVDAGYDGSGMLPALLSEPLFLPTRHNLMFTFDKIDAGAVSIRLFPVGGIFDTWSTVLVNQPRDKEALIALIMKLLERRKQIYPYWFTTDTGPMIVPVGDTVQQDVVIGDDGLFETTHLMGISANGSPGDAFEVEFYNPDTRQTLMNGRIHSSMLGNSFNPQPFPCSMIFQAGMTVRFIVKNLGNASVSAYITLRGRRIRAPLKHLAEIKRDLAVPGLPPSLAIGA